MDTEPVAQPDRSSVEMPAVCRPMACDYFRLSRSLWPAVLLRLCQLGADAVHVSVPWSWHQPADNWIDLHGVTHPQRDLIAFLKLCHRLQLPVHLAVELLPESGLIAWGIPMWLLQKLPTAQAVFLAQEPLLSPLPSLEHPAYVDYMQRWLEALSDQLLELQSPDGPIAAVTLAALPARDYNPHNTRVLWPVWLRQQYDGVGALNAAWGTNYDTFNTILLPEPSTAGDFPASRTPTQAVDEFFAWLDARWFNRRVEWMRQRGWRVPVLRPGDVLTTGPAPHVARVEDDLPTLGIGLTWAETAPVSAGGQPAPTFWAMKARTGTLPPSQSGAETAAIVQGDSGSTRLPAPSAGVAVHRLLLNGRLLPVKHRLARGHLTFDYQLIDAAGMTDMYLVQPQDTPTGRHLSTYFRRILSARGAALDDTAHLCRDLSSALAGGIAGEDQPTPGVTAMPETARAELLEAERSLERARLAVLKAAMSVDAIERQWSLGVSRSLPRLGPWLDLSTLTPEQRSLLAELATDCESWADRMQAAVQTMAAMPGQITSLPEYAAAWEELAAPVATVAAGAASWLTRLRVALNAGALPAQVWAVHDSVADIVRALTSI